MKNKIQQAPEALLNFILSKTPTAKIRKNKAQAVNSTEAIKRATEYLQAETTPVAVEGFGGDQTTYTVCARLHDFGLSEDDAISLLISSKWNEECQPPWSLDELTAKVLNAYSYSQNEIGCDSAEADFAELLDAELIIPKTKTKSLDIRKLEGLDTKLPKRRFLLGHLLIREKVTVIIAPPSAGKSTFSLQLAISLASKREDILGLFPHEKGKVLILNNEDDKTEQMRRLQAIKTYFNVDKNDLKDNLYVYSGVEKPFIIGKRNKNGNVIPVYKQFIIDYIKENDICLLIIDPFIETHMVNENSNEEIAQIGRMYREIAVMTECAVLIVHHTRKVSGNSEGQAGNMDSGRGASSLNAIARVTVTLYGMSEKDAEDTGVALSDRYKHVRLDGAKSNLSIQTGKPIWFKKESVEISNGDEVGVLKLDESVAEVEISENKAILDAVRIKLMANSGECTLNDMSKFVAESLADDESKAQTYRNKIKRIFKEKLVVDDWIIWYAEDNRPNPNGSGKVKHWIYGHIDAELNTDYDIFS